jgi:hypothetical protein
MKTINYFIAALVITVSAQSFSQDIFDKVKDKVKEKTKDEVKKKTNLHYYWAKVNINTSWMEAGEKKYQYRIYYTEVIFTEHEHLMQENFIKYFDKGIVEPLRSEGIDVIYYDSDVYLFPKDYSYETKIEAEEDMNKKLDNDKTWERPIYRFNWEPGKTPNGESTTQPKKIF